MDYSYTRDAAGRITRIDGLTAAGSWIGAPLWLRPFVISKAKSLAFDRASPDHSSL